MKAQGCIYNCDASSYLSLRRQASWWSHQGNSSSSLESTVRWELHRPPNWRELFAINSQLSTLYEYLGKVGCAEGTGFVEECAQSTEPDYKHNISFLSQYVSDICIYTSLTQNNRDFHIIENVFRNMHIL